MDIRQLKYFVTIVDCGSLSKAADQLYIAQSSLSLQLQTLEVELKTKLLLRSSQGVKPTESGKTLYRHARAMLRELDKINHAMKHGASGETGTVAVGLPTTVAAFLAHPLFDRIYTKFPGIHLHILETMSGYLAELLASGRLEMAVLFRDTPTRGVFVQPLFDEDLYLFGNAGLPEGVGIDQCPMKCLDGIPMVLPSTFHTLRPIIERNFASVGGELNVVAEIDSLPTRMAIARAGSACTILSYSNRLIALPEDQPLFRRLVNPPIHRTVSLCWPTSIAPNSASLAVYRSIVNLIGELLSEKTDGIRLRKADDAAFERSCSPL